MSSPRFQIKNIPISLISVPTQRFTSYFSDVNYLCRNIEVSQFVLPIVVKRTQFGFVLIDGYNRLMCAKKLGMVEVPAIIVSSDVNVNYVNMLINIVRGRRCGIDILEGINQLLSENVDTEKIATMLGRSKSTIKKYIDAYRRLSTQSTEVIQTIRENCVPIRVLIKCSSEENILDCILQRVSPVKKQEIEVKKILNKFTALIRHAIRSGVDVDLLYRKMDELIRQLTEEEKTMRELMKEARKNEG